MAKQPEDMVLRILQQIQATQADHSRQFELIEKRFDRVDRRLDELHDSAITALGLASHANVRHNTVQDELAELKKRVERLEEKL